MNSESTSTQPVYPLPSLHIQGFRAFKDLRLEHLGRVNLIVGKNNVGKSTLLEAIALYASGSSALHELVNLLRARQEFQRPFPQDESAPILDFKRAFHSHTKSSTGTTPLVSLRITSLPDTKNQIIITIEQISKREAYTLSIQFGHMAYGTSLPNIDSLLSQFSPSERLFTCHSIPARGLASKQLDWLWDSIVLTDQEQDVLRSLQIIAPEIERVSLAEGTRTAAQGRVPLVRRKGSSDPEPLRSMGDGMNRVFELALGLANSKGGLFLVDELENGVHYSAQEQLWRLIFETASQLNVQVFATTHSWDCIESFQRAASAHPSNGALISLARQEGEVKGTVFNERDLEIITRESIEVR
ncbi:ATP-binding protein [Cystobacter fuscus]|uniref:AAA family ATPase n=1 Tax=Cystobacter fuscus TaxID=43 RepID=UPI002B2F23F1|nr:ATP-binding protein [Cystobacter fuscus]